MTYFLIRTMRNQSKLLLPVAFESAEAARKAADERIARGMQVEARGFESDAQARMYVDPACAYFRALGVAA